MRAHELVTEANLGTNILVVDVQPAYDRWCAGVTPGICELLNRHKGKRYVLYNAQDVGVEDTEGQVAEYLYEHGLDYDIMMDGIDYFEKYYGFFRSWMDADVPEAAIIRVIRAMMQQRKRTSDELDLHQLFTDREYQLSFPKGPSRSFVPEDDPIHMPDFIGIAKLRQMQPFLMCGGGRNQCLREIELLCNAFNIRYRRIDSLIY